MNSLESDILDISGFADPFTEVKRKSGKNGVNLSLFRNGRNISFTLHSSGRISEDSGRKQSFAGVDALLASERFSDLQGFAKTQTRAAAARVVKNRIPASILVNEKPLDTANLAQNLELGAQQEKLHLLLIDGPAGVGKTFQIENLVSYQASRAEKGELAAPVLHVTSKGRRLSNLQDVLAAATQELSAQFFARHVPCLVRRGLLIVAIDGFDELVDADGYEDSWLALRQFISDVGHRGAVLLAARDTFVEQQELLTRIERSRKDVDLALGKVMPPSPDQAKDWLSSSPNWKPAELESELASDLLRSDSYALRPFFLRELWSAKGWSEVVDSGPRTFLVNRFVLREAKLIAQQVGGTTGEKVARAVSSLLQEVACEMASREVDFVEIEHLAFLTQFCFDGVVEDAAIRKLMHKSGSLALLELTADKRFRRFSHEEVRSYFLGLSILHSFSQKSVPAFLRRHILNCDELEAFAEVFANNPSESTNAARYCGALLSSELSSDALAPNVGAILMLMLALGEIERVDYADAVEATFAGLSPQGLLFSSTINRLDATGADVSNLDFKDVEVGILVVDDGTVVGRSIPRIRALEVRGCHGAATLRDRSEIDAWLASRSRASAISESHAVRLLEKVARRSVRHFYLREFGDEDEGSTLLSDPAWKDVARVLTKHSRLEIHRAKPMHGRPSPLIRIKNPLALLDFSDRETIKILHDVVRGERSES